MRLRFKASGFSFLPRQPIHSILSGRHASRLRGRGLNFEELRGYLPGDDTRNIDWKVTARTHKPHVRIYTEEKDRTVWLLVDQRMSMFFGSRWKMKSVVAAEATAVAAWRVLSQGDRVGAVIFDDSEIRVIPPQRSEERVAQILKRVITMNHALNARSGIRPEPRMLNRALERVASLARHDCLVCLVGDGSGIDEATRKYVTRLTEHNDVISVFIYRSVGASPARSRAAGFFRRFIRAGIQHRREIIEGGLQPGFPAALESNESNLEASCHSADPGAHGGSCTGAGAGTPGGSRVVSECP